jgi:osmotically inducible protein OsmC
MADMADVKYTAEATSSGVGRNGHVRSSDGFIDQELKRPVEMGGTGGGTNPEQLFAAGYAGCFHSAVHAVARKKGMKVENSSVDAAVSLTPDDTSFVLSVVLTGHLPGLDQSSADELMEAAHQICPYSKATRGNIEVQLKATV